MTPRRKSPAAKTALRVLRVPFEWLGIGLAFAVMSRLPRRAMQRLCDFLSAVMYALDGRGRRRALLNLRIVQGRRIEIYNPRYVKYRPTKAEALIIRRSYRNMARSVGHAIWTCRDARARVAEAGEMCEAGRRFLEANRTAVMVSGHIGCWEILSQLVVLTGHPVISVSKEIGTRGMMEMLVKARSSIGQEIVQADGAFRALMAGLKGGKSLGLLVDQVVRPRDGGVWVRFFGRPHPVSAGPAFFSAKGKVPIVVAWSRPLKDGRFRCEVLDEITPAESRDVWGVTQRCMASLESVIRRHPSCWVLNYNCFRKRPTAEELAELKSREARAAGKVP